MEWSQAFPTYTFQREIFTDAFFENILKRNLKKGRLGGPPLPWISPTLI
jgi:hypothetical protein